MVRQTLQETLHREVLRKILLLQSWVRTALERRHFLQLRRAAVAIQACWRSYSARRALERTQAAVCLQAAWRGYRQRRAYHRWCQSIIRLQSLCRGHLQRRRWVAGCCLLRWLGPGDRNPSRAQGLFKDVSSLPGGHPQDPTGLASPHSMSCLGVGAALHSGTLWPLCILSLPPQEQPCPAWAPPPSPQVGTLLLGRESLLPVPSVQGLPEVPPHRHRAQHTAGL